MFFMLGQEADTDCRRRWDAGIWVRRERQSLHFLVESQQHGLRPNRLGGHISGHGTKVSQAGRYGWRAVQRWQRARGFDEWRRNRNLMNWSHTLISDSEPCANIDYNALNTCDSQQGKTVQINSLMLWAGSLISVNVWTLITRNSTVLNTRTLNAYIHTSYKYNFCKSLVVWFSHINKMTHLGS